MLVAVVVLAAVSPDVVVTAIVTMIVGLAGSQLVTRRRQNLKLQSDATKTDADALASMLESARGIALWRKEALEETQAQVADLRKRVGDCERHTALIDELRQELCRERDRCTGAEGLRDRYLEERNSERDEHRETKLRLRDCEAELAHLRDR